MGITIHYELKFQGSIREALEKIKEVKEIAKKMPLNEIGPIWELDFSKDFNNDTENKRRAPGMEGDYRWAKIQLGHGEDKKNKGYVVMLHADEGCESTNIGLVSKDGKNWTGGAFTKTQYAKDFVKAHLLVISILDACNKIGILKSVSDEADYWETRDLKVLAENINKSTAFISDMANIFKNHFGGDKVSTPIDKVKTVMVVKNNGNQKSK